MFLGQLPVPFRDRDDPQPPDRVSAEGETRQIWRLGTGQRARGVEQQHRPVALALAQRERRGLVVPANAMAGPEPGHRTPGIGREPWKYPGRLGARQRGGDGELDPGVSAGVVEHLLDHGHPLAAHAHRGQDRVRTVRTRGPFGHSGQRQLTRGHVPVVPARPQSRLQVPEQRLLELPPTAARLPPAPVGPGPFQPGREPFHGVVERPAERRLADHVAAVAGHAAAGVGPARDDRERPPALQDRDPVPFLEPQRFQRAGLQRRPSARVLGARGGHQRRAPGVQPGLVGGPGSGLVVGDPGG